MPTIAEILKQFDQRAGAARARYWKAIREGTTAREARRVHDETRQQAFVDLVAEVQRRQGELTTLLDESTWTSLADSQAAPGYRDELEDGHALIRDFGTRVRLGTLWDLAGGPQPSGERPPASRSAVGSVDAAAGQQQPRQAKGFDMNDLIRGGS